MARMMLDCQCPQSGSCGRSGPVRATVVSASTPITYYTPSCRALYVHSNYPLPLPYKLPQTVASLFTVRGVVSSCPFRCVYAVALLPSINCVGLPDGASSPTRMADVSPPSVSRSASSTPLFPEPVHAKTAVRDTCRLTTHPMPIPMRKSKTMPNVSAVEGRGTYIYVYGKGLVFCSLTAVTALWHGPCTVMCAPYGTW